MGAQKDSFRTWLHNVLFEDEEQKRKRHEAREAAKRSRHKAKPIFDLNDAGALMSEFEENVNGYRQTSSIFE